MRSDLVLILLLESVSQGARHSSCHVGQDECRALTCHFAQVCRRSCKRKSSMPTHATSSGRGRLVPPPPRPHLDGRWHRFRPGPRGGARSRAWNLTSRTKPGGRERGIPRNACRSLVVKGARRPVARLLVRAWPSTASRSSSLSGVGAERSVERREANDGATAAASCWN